jgi:hypothetical protein
MDTPLPPHVPELTAPIRTDAEVLRRVEQIIDPDSRWQRSLWLFFLDRDDMQLPVIAPVDDLPDDPEPEVVERLCWVIAEVLSGEEPGGSVVMSLTRSGPAAVEDTDRVWHDRLRKAASKHAVRIRMMCLATPDGVQPLTG